MLGRYPLDLLIKFRTSNRFFQGKGKNVRALSRLLVIAMSVPIGLFAFHLCLI